MNMSYCRYENTLRALRDCYSALQSESESGEKLNQTELDARAELIDLCREIAVDGETLIDRHMQLLGEDPDERGHYAEEDTEARNI